MHPCTLHRQSRPLAPPAQRVRGVVLIMALIMLVIITMLATFGLRNAASTEMVSGNVRTTELATQAAESALRYCEQQTEAYIQSLAGSTVTVAITPLAYLATARWSQKTSGTLDYWDGSGSLTSPAWNAINASTVVNGTTTFKRPPECMIERAFDPAATDPSINTATFIITARGFGPEVQPADPSRTRPSGTEVWLQSTIGF